jgi:hypothetical protein
MERALMLNARHLDGLIRSAAIDALGLPLTSEHSIAGA